ncbi:hypothetical protein NEOLEDRAFT_1025532, partial [Neolentinus lepideus HHB14362 ss-1]
GKKAIWMVKDDEIIVRVLGEEKMKGNQSDNGWKKSVWTAVLRALESESHHKGAPKTAEHCGEHWRTVK